MTIYDHRPISSTSSLMATIKPALPPKPSHLSSAFTGTLDSDALRSYIRSQSINNTSSCRHNYHQAQSSEGDSTYSTCKRVSDTSRAQRANIEDWEGNNYRCDIDEDDMDNDDRANMWGTARQSQSISSDRATPSKPAYGSLASLFSSEAISRSGSEITVKARAGTIAAKPPREASNDSTDSNADFRTIKLRKTDVDGLQTSPEIQGDESPVSQSSAISSSFSTQRSRQPSILSRLSSFSDEEDDSTHEASLLQDTPKKRWMHVRDGSAFEHAGPKPCISSPSKVGETPVKIVSTLIAGPPPVRPSSLAIELPSDEINAEVERQVTSPNTVSSPQTRVRGKQARALYAFAGKESYNELSLAPGQNFEILNEDVSDGWSLALAWIGHEWRRGLVPRGWYTYVQEFASSPALLPEEGHKQTSSELSVVLLDNITPASTWLSLPSPRSVIQQKPQNSKGRVGAILSPEEANEHGERWDRARPASGVGKLYSGSKEAGSAFQILTHLHQSSSSIYDTSKDGLLPLSLSVNGCDVEEADAFKSSFASEGICVSREGGEFVGNVVPSKPTSLVPAWKPSGFFGGRNLNRFVPFVTSGAEEYLLFGKTHDTADEGGDATVEQARYDIVSGAHGGPAWKPSDLRIFAEVHSPEMQIDETGKQFTAFVVHSSYVLQCEEEEEWSSQDPHRRPEEAALTSSVYRRFTQFKWLANYLDKLFPLLVLAMPAFPSANHTAGKTARFEGLFVEKRRRQLQTWLARVARHPVLCNDEGVRFFLDSEEEGDDWTASAKETLEKILLEGRGAGASMNLFSKTFHPLFNVDMAESAIEVKQMTMFCNALQRGLNTPDTGILATFKHLRETTSATSDSYRQFSYSLLRLITGSLHLTPVRSNVMSHPGTLMNFDNHIVLPPMGNVGRRDASGATNEERAWCWREGCLDCKKLTKSLQGTAEALQTVADLYESHSNADLFTLHDRLVTMAKLNLQHGLTLEVHKATLAKYSQATDEAAEASLCHEMGDGDEKRDHKCPASPVDGALEHLSNRHETIMNITTSEMDRIHQERTQDWNSQTTQLLDSQISFYEDILATLRRARCQVEQSADDRNGDTLDRSNDGPILPSPFESQLDAPLRASPLLQPEQISSSYLNIWK
ncbi:hypothetical protein CBS101457_005451 [Exobasidium rhododendri]|nr:hypothetical protein CBS101457_005451 [Exobasidium rhododendri]